VGLGLGVGGPHVPLTCHMSSVTRATPPPPPPPPPPGPQLVAAEQTWERGRGCWDWGITKKLLLLLFSNKRGRDKC